MKKKFPVDHVILEDKKEVWMKGSHTLALGAESIQKEYFPGYKICFASQEYLNQLKQTMTFTVYSKDGCPYCTKVQQVLEAANLEHVVYKLGKDFTRDQFISEFGEGTTFPQVIMNDQEKLGGCVETVKYLKGHQLV